MKLLSKQSFYFLRLLLCSMGCLFFSSIFSQYVYKGNVQSVVGDKLAGATIGIDSQKVNTDNDGNFTFNAATASVQITISASGYSVMQMQANANQLIYVQLTPTAILLPGMVVTAFDSQTRPENIAAAVAVLSKAAIENFGAASPVHTFNTVAGVKMDERSPGSYRLNIRSNLLRATFGVRNVKVYWNGIPFSDAGGNTFINDVPLQTLGSVEIIKGLSGSSYGAGTGGVVLLRSDADAPKATRVFLNTSAGSYGLQQVTAGINANHKNNHSLTFSHLQSNGYRAHSAINRNSINYHSTIPLSGRNTLSANVLYTNLYYQTPGGLTSKELLENPRQSRPAAGIFKSAITQKAAVNTERIYAGIGNKYANSRGFSHSEALFFNYRKANNFTIRNAEGTESRGLGTRVVLQQRAGAFKITAGAEYQYGFDELASYKNKQGVRDSLQFTDRVKLQNGTAFFQTEYQATSQLKFTTGLSVNDAGYDFTRDDGSLYAPPKYSYKAQWVPRFAVMQQWKKNSVYIVVSKGFSPPTINEIHAGDDTFNGGLLPEMAWSYEAGTKSNWFNNHLQINTAIYLLKLKNTIVGSRTAAGGDFFINAGNTTTKSVEVEATYNAIEKGTGTISGLAITGAYTYQQAVFGNYNSINGISAKGNKLTGSAPHTVSAAVQMQVANKITMAVNYLFTDKLPLNNANTVSAAAYQLLYTRLSLNSKFGKKIAAAWYGLYQWSFNNPYSLGNDLNAAGGRFFNAAAPKSFEAGIALSHTTN